jgi:hypothetical protein
MLRTEPEPVVLLTTLVFLSLIELDTYLHCIKEKKQTSPLTVLLPTTKEHIKSYIDID